MPIFLRFNNCTEFLIQSLSIVRDMQNSIETRGNLSGAPNDRMFPNTPEMSQMPRMVFPMLWKPVRLIWSCPKNYLSVRMS